MPWTNRFTRCFLLLISLSQISEAVSTDPITIRYHAAKDDTRYADLVFVLKRSLEITESNFGPYLLKPIDLPMSESRQLENLKQDKWLDVVWSSTSDEKEQALLPVRIPMRQGLLGYRLLITHKDRSEIWKNVKTLDDFRKVSLVQGLGWGDIALYQHSDIKVIPLRYELAFKAIHLGNVDAFPRGIMEIYPEINRFRPDLPNLIVEPTLALYYPWPYYLFVNRNNIALHKRLTTGLRTLAESGELHDILVRFFGEDIKRANLTSRRIIRLENPFLPAATPTNQPEYWYKVE